MVGTAICRKTVSTLSSGSPETVANKTALGRQTGFVAVHKRQGAAEDRNAQDGYQTRDAQTYWRMKTPGEIERDIRHLHDREMKPVT